MGRAADECVGGVGQRVEHVVSDQTAVLGPQQGLHHVVDHLCVDRAWKGGEIHVNLNTITHTHIHTQMQMFT